MKVLMVNTGVFPVPTPRGGAENHAYYLSKSLSEQGVEIDLVSDIGNNAEFGNINVYPVNLPEFSLFDKGFKGYILRHFIGGFYAFKKARELLKSNHYDVVHVHGRVAPFALSLFKNNIPLVFTLNDDPPSEKQPYYYTYKVSYKCFQEPAAKKANQVIVPTDDLIVYLNQKGTSKKRIIKIPNGVDTTLFSPNGTATDTPCALFVGSLIARKGIKYFIEAICEVEDVKCKIIGEGPDETPLIRLSRDLQSQNRVEFIGSIEQKNLPEFYNKSSFLVVPSLSETTCIAILEAFACGKPVIASSVGDIPNLVKNGYNGFLVEPKNVEQLREKIKLLVENPCLCRELGENARRTVEGKYSWDIVAERVINVYDKVLEKPGGFS